MSTLVVTIACVDERVSKRLCCRSRPLDEHRFRDRTIMADSEQDLVNRFTDVLSSNESPWGRVRFTREFDYQRGRTDIVVLNGDGHLVAVEAKLSRWRDALQQAYRNRCFAHTSYVLLPKPVALRAVQYAGDFQMRGVGVCYCDADAVSILIEAPLTPPLQPWLSEVAGVTITGEAGDCAPA